MNDNENGTGIEIARVGRFRDSGGGWHDFSLARLEKMAADYDPEKREAPLVIGHPQTNAPAYGYIKRLKVQGDKLLAYPACVSDTVKRLVDNGYYRRVSMSLYNDGGLRHLGLLGANPPAIDGLAPVSFSDDAALIINFSEGFEPEPDEPELKGYQMTVDDLTRQLAELQAKLTAALQEKDAAVKELAELKERLGQTEKEAEKTEAEFAAYRDKRAGEILTVRIDQLVKDGKLAPAEKDVVGKTAEALRQGGPYNFADGTENPLETYLKSLEARRPSELFSNFSAPETDAGGGAVSAKPLSAKL